MGSLALTVGAVLLLLAGLRALQTETGTSFTGNLSWLPYLFTVARWLERDSVDIARFPKIHEHHQRMADLDRLPGRAVLGG